MEPQNPGNNEVVRQSKNDSSQYYVNGMPLNVAVGFGPINQLPPGAKVISNSHVKDLQNEVIKNWTPNYEMWPVQYAPAAAGLSSAFCGLVLNGYFRRKFDVGNTKRLLSNFCVAFPSTYPALFWHQVSCSESIRLQLARCELCDTMRSACIQVVGGTFVPTVFALLMSTAVGRFHGTYAIPAYYPEAGYLSYFKEMTKFMGRSVISSRNIIGWCCIAQFMFGSALAVIERSTAIKINNRVLANQLIYDSDS